MRKLSITPRITQLDSQSLKLYLREIEKIPVLTSAEENICAVKVSQGDLRAKEELITKNLRFVISVAKQYIRKDISVCDLINEGNIGLIVAVEKYDATRGFKFISWAVWYIRKYINDYLANNGLLIRLPNNKIYGISKINQVIDKMEQKLERKVELHEVLDEPNLNKAEIKSCINVASYKFDSLDRELYSDLDSCYTLIDRITDNSCDSADHLATENDLKIEVNKFLYQLKPKQRQVLTFCFGLNGEAPMTIREVAEKFNMTTEGVRLTRKKALSKMKSQMKFHQEMFF